MTKKWNYHDIPNEVLNTPLKHLREEYNIELTFNRPDTNK